MVSSLTICWLSMPYNTVCRYTTTPRRYGMHKMRPIATHASVVCLLVTIVIPAKTAEPIKVPFWLCTRVGQRNHVLDGISDPPYWRGTFGEDNTWACPRSIFSTLFASGSCDAACGFAYCSDLLQV